MPDLKQDSRIWVGHISKDASERDLKEKFSEYGSIREIKFVTSGRFDNYAFIQYDSKECADQAMDQGDRAEICGKGVRVGPANPPSDSKNDERRRNRSPPTQNGDRRRNRSPSPRSPSPARGRISFYEKPARRASRSRSREMPTTSSRSGKYKLKIVNLPADMTWQELKRLGGDYGKSVAFARTWRENDGVAGVLEFTESRDCDKVLDALDGKKMEGCERRLRVDREKDEEEAAPRRVRSEERGRRSRY